MRSSEWVLVGGLLVAFVPALLSLSAVWSSVDYYSHGFLVPVVAFWIARQQAGRAALRSGAGTPLGLAVLVVALGLYAVGLTGGSASLQGLAFIGALAGLVLHLRGPDALRALAFPIAFLGFMIPLPGDWITPFIVKLQLIVSSGAVDFLHLFDVAVARQGNVLLLPGGETLFVDEACSGITSIVTLTPLAVVLAYYTGRGVWRRVALVAAVLPVAMLWNLVRVVATVVAARSYGAEVATGSALHESAGLVTFVAACLVLIGLSSLLRRGPQAA